MILGPYAFLVLALVATMLALEGISPASLFATAAVAFWLLFAVMTLQVYRRHGL